MWPSSPSSSSRNKVLQQLLSKQMMHSMLVIYAAVTSLVLVVFLHKFSSSDLCSSSTSSSSPHSPFLSSLREEDGYSSSMDSLTLLHSVEMSHLKVNKSFQPFSPSSTKNIWDLFVPEQSCSDLSRVGGVGDGGKFVCGLSFLRDKIRRTKKNESPPCIVYSYGVSTDSSFEIDILERGLPCEIHAFDPTIGKMNIPNHSELGIGGGSITFHKIGLSKNFSGPSNTFMLTEHLLDTMLRLNHSFIDILKIDVEGDEWEIIPGVFEQASRLGLSAPLFGQLLVELHYDSVASVLNLFESLSEHGYSSFSREINLQPCMSGQLPRAVEYSFINPSAFFGFSRNHQVPPAVTPAYHGKVSAVIYYLTQKIRTKMMGGALQSLYDNFWKQFPFYPVLIFHDDLDKSSMEFLQSAVPNMPLTFISISFTIPTNLQPFTLPDRLPCSPHSSTIGYRHMIRFHATLIHEYLFDPRNGYHHTEYLLRLDDDSSFHSPLGYDIFQLMRGNHLDFGFVNTVPDDEKCIHGLWNHSVSFMKRHGSYISVQNKKQFHEWQEGLVIYNNFELSRMAIWKSKLWRDFMSSIESSGGIYLKRWGDAPIHTIFLLLGVNASRVHAFSDIAYQHRPFANQVPSGLPKPQSNPFAVNGKCVYYDRWRCGNFTNSSNTSHQLVPTGPLHPLWSPEKYMESTEKDKVSHHSSSPPAAIRYSKKVMYTFAHVDRVHFLAETISNFYLNYIKQNPVAFVIFHYSSLNASSLEWMKSQWSKKGVGVSVRFVEVESPTESDEAKFASYDHSCIGTNSEVYHASRFLISNAPRMLHSMGYEWFFRVADDSKLQAPVREDLFDRLERRNRRYGFLSVVRDNPKCLGHVWSSAAYLCGPESHSCSPLMSSWPAGVVVMTSFELSHYSIWESAMFARLVKLMGPSHQSTVNASTWSDSSIHTLGVLMVLQEDQVEWMQDIPYTARMNSNGRVAPHRDSHSTSPHLTTSSLPHFNKKFQSQRFGWLGGDVAVSCLLPAASELQALLAANSKTKWNNNINNNINNNMFVPESSRYIWLFGDSLIGTSTSNRRLEGEMISNSVAVVDIDSTKEPANRIQKVSYYWRSSDEGFPMSIFDEKQVYDKYTGNNATELQKHRDHIRYWPFSALAVATERSPTKLVVIGQLVQTYQSSAKLPRVLVKASGGLSFYDLASMAMVVHNPYDPPDLWRTETLELSPKSFLSKRFKWLSMTTSSNHGRFASEQDYVYILSSYTSDMNPLSSGLSHIFDGFSVESKWQSSALLRVKAIELIRRGSSAPAGVDPRSVQVLCQSDDRLQWLPLSAVGVHCTPQEAIPAQASEPHFFYDSRQRVFKIIYLEISDSSIRVCQSAQVEGPYDCTSTSSIQRSEKNRMSYAAKAHVELAGENDEVVISYITNTADGPAGLFEEGHRDDLYVPQFISTTERSKHASSKRRKHRSTA